MHAQRRKLSGLDPSSATGLSGGGDLALGTSLGGVLREICDGRLGEISWFRATWQRGGAATGFSTWTFTNGRTIEVMVKLPVGPVEQSWTMRMGAVDPESWDDPASERLPTPRVVASGEALAGYDLSWIVMERFRGLPLVSGLCQKSLERLIETTAAFQARALRVAPVAGEPVRRDYRALLDRSREALSNGGVPNEERWERALDGLEPRLDGLLGVWRSRAIDSWCHGDVHPANAMWRQRGDGEKHCVLIDLALVHPGSWLEDGLYLERQFWGNGDLLEWIDPVETLAEKRRSLGLEVADGYRELAEARRMLMTAGVPGLLGAEGNSQYADGALRMLESWLERA